MVRGEYKIQLHLNIQEQISDLTSQITALSIPTIPLGFLLDYNIERYTNLLVSEWKCTILAA